MEDDDTAINPPSYRLLRRRVNGLSPDEYAWVVQVDWISPRHLNAFPIPCQGVFPSLAAEELRSWVSTLPSQSHIVFTHTVSGRRRPSEALPTSVETMLEDFTHFCKGEGVVFMAMTVAL